MRRWWAWCAALGIGCGSSSSTPPSDAGADVHDVPTSSGPFHFASLGTHVDKVDLLLMIDNSASMADKFGELGRRLPSLLKALTNPDVDPATGRLPLAVSDLHVGVVTSSLGGHGTSLCDPSKYGPHVDDHGHLLPRAGENGAQGYTVASVGGVPTKVACPSPVAATAIGWAYDPSAGSERFVGAAQSADAQAASTCVVESVAEDGCGYEAQLESIFHFLVDPAPYLTADVACTKNPAGDECGQNKITPNGVDQEILTERAAFLRPDSLLAVLMLTDENDGSLLPAGLNWIPLAYGKGTMLRGWKACDDVPDDFEPQTNDDYQTLKNTYGCQSCFQPGVDPGGNCSVPWAITPTDSDVDGRNERMLQHTRRYGYNFLWGRKRYVDAFTATMVTASDGTLKPNPIYAGGLRTKDLVLVAGILGVPKQIVPTRADGSLADPTEADWDKMIAPDLAKRDPHMIESIAPRSSHGIATFAGDRKIDLVNGGDRHVPTGDDLQYACIGLRQDATGAPDCFAPNADQLNPICQSVGGAMTQPYFKAYPTLRELRVLHELGAAGVKTSVASICDASYGPALDAIAAKLQTTLRTSTATCAPLPFTVRGEFASCALFEVFGSDRPGGAASCATITGARTMYCTPGEAPCRVDGTTLPPISAASAVSMLHLPVRDASGPTVALVPTIAADGNAYVTGADGVRRLVCEVVPLAGNPSVDALTTTACMHDPGWAPAPDTVGGWCWTNDPKLDHDCANAAIRVVGDVGMQPGSQVAIACLAKGA
jgi:hypothetical protein